MIRFEIDFSKQKTEANLLYEKEEFSFHVDPHVSKGVASVLINDLQIEVDVDGNAIYVWGLCPYTAWKKNRDDPPEARPGRLKVSWGEDIVPGVSKRIGDRGSWQVTFNPESGWIRIHDPASNNISGELVEFATGALAQVDNGKLQSLWLRPIKS